MKIILQDGNKYILRFDRDEDLIASLQVFCQKTHIHAGYFSGIGAAKEALLGFYDLRKKEYFEETIKDDINLEIVGLSGNITIFQQQVIVHAHGIFADRKYKTYAGHVKRLVISVTCELVLEKMKGQIERKQDEETGLNLLR